MSYLRCGADRWRSEAAAAAEDDDGGEKCLELSGQNTRACVHLHVTSARGSSLAKLSSRAHSHVVTMQTPREEADVPPCFYFETHLYLHLRGEMEFYQNDVFLVIVLTLFFVFKAILFN